MNICHEHEYMPDWKVCTARARNRLRSFDVIYIYSIKFCQSCSCILQTFQSGIYEYGPPQLSSLLCH